jgi:hypothetical protein
MRKFIFLFTGFIAFLPMVLNAQLKVLADGNVEVYTSGSVPHVSNERKLSIETDRYVGLRVLRSGSLPFAGWTIGLEGSLQLYQGGYNFGVYGQTISDSPLNSSRAYGVFGRAGNSTSGYNYGLVGTLDGEQYGAAVYGGFSFFPGYISGRYAGYFNGNVYINGTVNGIFVSNSDIRFKQNITELSDKQTSVLENILNLNPIEYNLKQISLAPASDTTTVEENLFDEKSQLFKKKQYGLIAQEVQQLYPDLVYENEDGYLSINYTGVIPLLIASVKELNEKIEKLENVQKAAPVATGTASNVQEEYAALYQNTPNPFSQSTRIRFYLPQNIKTASLNIYNLQGKQLKQIAIAQRGESSQQIAASEFEPGIYLYALIADGQEIDVKRMILTE